MNDMELRKVVYGSPYLSLIEVVNLEAFPEEERLPAAMMAELCAKGDFDLWAVCDGEDDEFLGFTATVPSEVGVYVFFLAVERFHRGHGYGGRILDLLREQYPGRPLFLDIEPLDPAADNLSLREGRKAFYLRNGFSESGYFFKYCGMEFEVLYTGRDRFDKDAFWHLMNKIGEAFSAYGIGGYEPRLDPYPSFTKQ